MRWERERDRERERERERERHERRKRHEIDSEKDWSKRNEIERDGRKRNKRKKKRGNEREMEEKENERERGEKWKEGKKLDLGIYHMYNIIIFRQKRNNNLDLLFTKEATSVTGSSGAGWRDWLLSVRGSWSQSAAGRQARTGGPEFQSRSKWHFVTLQEKHLDDDSIRSVKEEKSGLLIAQCHYQSWLQGMVNNADKLIGELECIYRHLMSGPLSILILKSQDFCAELHLFFCLSQFLCLFTLINLQNSAVWINLSCGHL